MKYTTEDLIDLVRERETIPDSGSAYSEDVLLRYLDQSLKAFIVPAIEATLEEHFVVTRDFQIPQFNTSPTSPPTDIPNAITIPSESTGLRLRDVYIVGSSGSFINVPRLTPTQAASMAPGWWGTSQGNNVDVFSSGMGGFFLQGNTVQIFPYGLASGKTVRVTFQRAPGDLVLTSEAGRITAIVGDVITMDKIVSGWTAGTECALVSGESPNDYLIDKTVPVVVYTAPKTLNNFRIISAAANIVVLPIGYGADVKVGDWICPANSSVFAQNIPRALLPVLVQKAAEMCIHAAGDAKGTAVANKEYNDMMKMAIMQIAPRVIGKPVKILPTNSAFSASRNSSFGRW